MLSLIVKASSNPDDIVLDCFCGSGTTLDISSQLNRQWIGIDNSPAALDTVLHRFAKGLEPMGDFVNKKTKANQLPLFDTSQSNTVNDFSLYVSEPYDGEIDEVVKLWKSRQ